MTELLQVATEGAEVAVATDDEASIFSLPSDLQEDERWQKLYKAMIAKLRKEAEGIPMTTMQEFLIERIATTYVTIKHREEKGTFLPKEATELTNSWLAMAKQFSALVKENQDGKNAKRQEQMLKLVLTTVQDIPDASTRQMFRERLTVGLKQIDEGTYEG